MIGAIKAVMRFLRDMLQHVLIWLFLLFASAYAAYSTAVTSFYRNTLPAQIGTIGFASSGSDMPLIALPVVREACGAVVHTLDWTSRWNIGREGLSFFAEARQGRGYPRQEYWSYEAWAQTPMATHHVLELERRMRCAGFDRSLIYDVSTAAVRPGSFQTSGREKLMIVAPDLGLVVMAYDG